MHVHASAPAAASAARSYGTVSRLRFCNDTPNRLAPSACVPQLCTCTCVRCLGIDIYIWLMAYIYGLWHMASACTGALFRLQLLGGADLCRGYGRRLIKLLTLQLDQRAGPAAAWALLQCCRVCGYLVVASEEMSLSCLFNPLHSSVNQLFCTCKPADRDVFGSNICSSGPHARSTRSNNLE